MIANILPRPATTTHRLRQEKRVVGARAQALAERVAHGAETLAALATTLDESQWRIAMPHDGRTVGDLVHHVASAYPTQFPPARALASGQPIEEITPDDVQTMNAAHATPNAAVTRDKAVALLRRNSQLAALAIRALSDEELDRALPASFYGHAPVTCQFVLEDHAVRHSYHHAARIRAVLGL
jgi:hypothetical protein